MQRPRGDFWFYYPSRQSYGHPSDFKLDYESVFFHNGIARLHGWFLNSAGRAKGTVLHCHGNAGNITGHFQFVAWMPAYGWNVFCFDYQGYGRSEGRPTRPGTIADTNAAIDYLRSRPDVDRSRLVVFGQSLGAAVGLVAASARDDLRGVAAEGAFSSYRSAVQFVCRRGLLLRGAAPFISRVFSAPGLDPIDHVARIAPTPTFFICGTADRICDHRQTIELHRAAGPPKSLWLIEGGRHTEALVSTNGEGPRRLDRFLTECVE